MALGFGGEIGCGNANVYRTVVLPLHLGAYGGGLVIGGFRDHQEDRSLPGEAIHPHTPGGSAHGFCCGAPGYSDVIGLGVAGRGSQAGGLQAGKKLLLFHRAGGVIGPAALAGAGNFQIIHWQRLPSYGRLCE